MTMQDREDWAVTVLKSLGVHFETSECGWDVLTVSGWISVETAGGLAQVATRCQAEQMAGRAQGTSPARREGFER